MTETTGAPSEGHIHSPNPIELFWEKNRRTIQLVIVLLIAAVGANYAIQYFNQKAVDDRWSSFAKLTGFDRAYVEDGAMLGIVRQAQGGANPNQFWTLDRAMGFYLQDAQGGLVRQLHDHVKNLDGDDLRKGIADHAGHATEPLLLWVAAHHAMANGEWQAATDYLKRLQSGHADHFLVAKSDYPLQFRAEKKKDKKKDEDEENGAKKQDDKPEYVDPVGGESAVSLALAAVASQQKFRAANAHLYEAVEPDAAPTATVSIKNEQTGEVKEFKIRFFAKDAPKHVENFLARVKAEFYQGLRVDEVRKKGTGENATDQPKEFSFGLAITKEEDDKTKWVAPAADDESKKKDLDFEYNSLSHFPGMVAAWTATDGKSSSERIWINATDAAKSHDGERVIFGRVVEGLEAVEVIADTPLSSEDEDRSGSGKPRDLWTIDSIKIEE